MPAITPEAHGALDDAPRTVASGTAALGTVAEWLALRSPPAPPALLARMNELLAADGGRPVVEAPQVCLSAGESRLAVLLAHGATDRTSALDLLAVDALVSYAFEAAAETPEMLEQIATDAMTRIAEIPEAP